MVDDVVEVWVSWVVPGEGLELVVVNVLAGALVRNGSVVVEASDVSADEHEAATINEAIATTNPGPMREFDSALPTMRHLHS